MTRTLTHGTCVLFLKSDSAPLIEVVFALLGRYLIRGSIGSRKAVARRSVADADRTIGIHVDYLLLGAQDTRGAPASVLPWRLCISSSLTPLLDVRHHGRGVQGREGGVARSEATPPAAGGCWRRWAWVSSDRGGRVCRRRSGN